MVSEMCMEVTSRRTRTLPNLTLQKGPIGFYFRVGVWNVFKRCLGGVWEIFWTIFFWDQKIRANIFWEPTVFQTQNFRDTKFLSQKPFGTKNFSSHKTFWNQSPKTFWMQLYFWTQFFGLNFVTFFLPKFCTQNHSNKNFLDLKFLDLNLFLDPNFIWSQNFTEYKIFWT